MVWSKVDHNVNLNGFMPCFVVISTASIVILFYFILIFFSVVARTKEVVKR